MWRSVDQQRLSIFYEVEVRHHEVNFFEEIVVQTKEKNLLSANIAAIKRIDEAQKSLMNIMA